MTRRLLPLAAAFAVTFAACAPNLPSFAPGTTARSGKRFVPEQVDIKKNAGAGVSIAVDAKGLPVLVYLRLDEKEVIPSAPSPSDPKKLPAVLVATQQDEAWVRGVVAEDLTGLTVDDSTDLALDAAEKRHAVWSVGGKAIDYQTFPGHGFAPGGDQKAEEVATGDVRGPSVAVGSSGAPWVAFYEGGSVKAATKSGDTWTVETLGPASIGDGTARRTDIAVTAGGDPVVAYGDGEATKVATRSGGTWTSEVAAPEGGFGVGLALDGDGHRHVVSYSSTGVVFHAESAPGGAWNAETVAPGAGAVDPGWSASIALDAQGKHYIVWYDSSSKAVEFAVGPPFSPAPMPDAAGGQSPEIAIGPNGEVEAAWYRADTTSLAAALYTDKFPALAVPQPSLSPQVGPTTAACKPDGTDLTISAEGVAFSTDCLAAPAGKAFKLTFENKEAVPHNVEIFTDSTASAPLGGAKDASDTVAGPKTVVYDVKALEKGTFYFQCDVHPTAMNGTFIVA